MGALVSCLLGAKGSTDLHIFSPLALFSCSAIASLTAGFPAPNSSFSLPPSLPLATYGLFFCVLFLPNFLFQILFPLYNFLIFNPLTSFILAVAKFSCPIGARKPQFPVPRYNQQRG